MQDEGTAATAGDENANDEYAVNTAMTGAPVPPEIFPDELAKQQAPVQGGDTGEGGAAHPAPDDEDQRGDGEDDGDADDEDGETVPVDSASRSQLEAAAGDLDVQGTGSNGYVTSDDLKKALKGAGVTEVPAR